MSQETFEIVKGMDLKSIETQLALQCAPLITGLKISNLLIVENEKVGQVRKILRNTKLGFYILFRGDEKTTFLLFRYGPLMEYLQKPEVGEFLLGLGYQTDILGRRLTVFADRYGRYMSGKGEFPHEMGIFLGYPVEDVSGFMENEGKNYLYAGYWKVYRNEAAKKDLFRKYEQAKETLIRLVARGMKMPEVIARYSENSFLCMGHKAG